MWDCLPTLGYMPLSKTPCRIHFIYSSKRKKGRKDTWFERWTQSRFRLGSWLMERTRPSSSTYNWHLQIETKTYRGHAVLVQRFGISFPRLTTISRNERNRFDILILAKHAQQGSSAYAPVTQNEIDRKIDQTEKKTSDDRERQTDTQRSNLEDAPLDGQSIIFNSVSSQVWTGFLCCLFPWLFFTLSSSRYSFCLNQDDSLVFRHLSLVRCARPRLSNDINKRESQEDKTTVTTAINSSSSPTGRRLTQMQCKACLSISKSRADLREGSLLDRELWSDTSAEHRSSVGPNWCWS